MGDEISPSGSSQPSSRFARAVWQLRGGWRAALERRRKRGLAGVKLLRAFADAYPTAYFIQIGANDGIEDDRLRPFIACGDWSGLMVEPMPRAFERLERNCAPYRDRLTLENAAIADRDGHLPLFEPVRVVDGRIVNRLDTLASVSRATAEMTAAAFVPERQRRIITTNVPCLRFATLCRKHGVKNVDLLVLDAEGHDYEIVKQLDFGVCRPRLLVYEHLLLAPDDRAACRDHLRATAYETMEEEGDTWCLDTRPEDQLTRTWRELRAAAPPASIYGPSAAKRVVGA